MRSLKIRSSHERQFGQNGWRGQRAVGKAKQGIGSAVGSDKMKADGAAQELKGDVQKATGDAKNATKNVVDKTAAALKKPL